METQNETPHLPLDSPQKKLARGSRFTQEEQRDFAQRALVSGMAHKDFAASVGVPYTTLKNWIRKYRKARAVPNASHRNAAKEGVQMAAREAPRQLQAVQFKVASEVEEAQATKIRQLERRIEVLEEENTALMKTVKVLGHQLVRDDEQ